MNNAQMLCLSEEKQCFEAYLASILEGVPLRGKVGEAVRHAFRAGKRLRPLMMLAAAKALGGRMAPVLPAAACVEMIHTASLILDDMPEFDNSTERRSAPSVHVLFGRDVALLASFELVSSAYVELAKSGRLCRLTTNEITAGVRSVSSTIGLRGMVGSKEREMQKSRTAEADYYRLIEMKTSSLFQLAAKLVAILCRLPSDSTEKLVRLGRNIGIAYQMADDIRDLEQDRMQHGCSCILMADIEEARGSVARHLSKAIQLASALGGRGNSLQSFVLAVRDLIA